MPVESVEPNQDVSLEGFTSCNVRSITVIFCTTLIDPLTGRP